MSDSTKKAKRAAYFVYILVCEDRSYYTGYTNNLAMRLERHRRGHGARYTRMRKPTRIAFVMKFITRRAAMRMERQIKSLSHEKKRLLILQTRLSTREILARVQ